ncbi:MAG: hypothetical protein PF517_15210 [Salinivirgaceae bacterium]|jgi:hypothetical protein|nr:hypothetical protein [Salinivirgaceae bacterium]
MLKPRPIYCPNVILLHSENNEIFSVLEAKAIIEKVTKGIKVITVYIHHEFNDLDESQIVVKNYDYSIYKETRKKSGNVTSEFLNAGSDYVYYVKADMENYRAAFVHLFDILSNNYLIICIASSLGAQLKAGAIVVENDLGEQHFDDLKKKIYFPDKLFTTSAFLEKRVVVTDNSIEVE